MLNAHRPPAAEPADTSATWDWMERVADTAPERGLQTLILNMLEQCEAQGHLPTTSLQPMVVDPSTVSLGTLVALANALGCEWRVELVPNTANETPPAPSETSPAQKKPKLKLEIVNLNIPGMPWEWRAEFVPVAEPEEGKPC